MLQLEVLVVEFGTVDALAAGAVAGRKVTALDHELLDNAVEAGALVVQGNAALAEALLAGAQSAKVLSGLGYHVVVQLHENAANLAVANLNVEEDAAARRRLGLLSCHGW